MRSCLGIGLALATAFAPQPVLAAQLVAVVEVVETGAPKVAELELLEAGQVVGLGRGDRIVVGYLDSCTRETIAGPGQVRIGTSLSRLEGAALVDRRTVDCQGTPTAGNEGGAGAATRLRSATPAAAAEATPITPEQTLAGLREMRDRQLPGRASHRQPVLLLADPAPQVLLVPVEGQGEPRRLRAKGALVDLAEGAGPLEPGLWLARRGDVALAFLVPGDAESARASPTERLIDY